MGRIANVQTVPIKDLRPYERNAKIHSRAQVEKIAASIEEFGFISPCLIDQDMNIIAGHGRVMAAELLNIDAVPCVFIEGLTEEQRRAYILADNRLTELGEWDMELVNSELDELAAAGFAVEITGFDWDSATEIGAFDDNYDPDGEEAAALEPRTKLGDIWQLGNHRLMCGDSTSSAALDELFNGENAAFVFTDPPYGVSIGSKNKRQEELTGKKSTSVTEDIIGDTMSPGALYEMLVKAFANLRNHCEDYCSYYVSSPQNGELLMMMMMMRDAGIPVKHMLLWIKNGATFNMGSLDYAYRHEPIFYTWTKTHRFRGGYDNTVIDANQRLEELSKAELKELVHALRGDGSTTAIYCDKPLHNDLHPTMKPIRLVARFMYNSSEEGDAVADIFGGSGTTIIVAEQLKRRCYMMEYDPHYCDVIIDRWEQFTGEKAVKVNG